MLLILFVINVAFVVFHAWRIIAVNADLELENRRVLTILHIVLLFLFVKWAVDNFNRLIGS